MPLDPRRDSGEMSQSSPDVSQHPGSMEMRIMARLDALDKQGEDTRAAVKELAIGVSSLKGSHDDHRRSLQEHGSNLLELKHEGSKVKLIADTALSTAQEAKRGVSSTNHDLSGTLAGVKTSQDLVAKKAQEVERKTDAIVERTEAIAQETTGQSTLLAEQRVMLKKIQMFSPVLNAAAIAIATAVAYALSEFARLHH
jgi:chromosome segregation ATPase